MEQLMADIITYMNQEVGNDLKVADVSRHFNYSNSHFSREFKRLTGVSAKEYLSALKIQKSLNHLLKSRDTVLKTHLSVGYLSPGTFSTTFKKSTGATPKTYRQNLSNYFESVKRYEQTARQQAYYRQQLPTNQVANSCRVTLECAKECELGVIFVGLFTKPIPNRLPVVGMALTTLGTCHFEGVPAGRYYLLGCAIEKSNNPLHYFLLNQSLRGRIAAPILFPRDTQKTYSLLLREAKPEDPPILFNFPKLLMETLNRGR